MKKLRKSISFRNLTRRPGRSIALIALAAFLAFSVFAGTMVVQSLRSGLDSLQDRLGADIMVVPYEATTKTDLKNIILQGNTGSFYMNNSVLDKIAEMEGIDQVSAQFYLASLSAGCCSIPVQIIGYEPETDFTITPWVKRSTGSQPGDMEVVVGNDLNAFVGDTLTFYNTDVHVVGKLDQTGTNLDTAVYTNAGTIRALIIMIITFSMSVNERKKEFAILRVTGASRKKLAGIVTGEGAMVSLAGSVAGVLAGCMIVVSFGHYIESQLKLPFLLPGGAEIAVLVFLSVAAAAAAGLLTSMAVSYRITRMDTGLILREGT